MINEPKKGEDFLSLDFVVDFNRGNIEVNFDGSASEWSMFESYQKNLLTFPLEKIIDLFELMYKGFDPKYPFSEYHKCVIKTFSNYFEEVLSKHDIRYVSDEQINLGDIEAFNKLDKNLEEYEETQPAYIAGMQVYNIKAGFIEEYKKKVDKDTFHTFENDYFKVFIDVDFD